MLVLPRQRAAFPLLFAAWAMRCYPFWRNAALALWVACMRWQPWSTATAAIRTPRPLVMVRCPPAAKATPLMPPSPHHAYPWLPALLTRRRAAPWNRAPRLPPLMPPRSAAKCAAALSVETRAPPWAISSATCLCGATPHCDAGAAAIQRCSPPASPLLVPAKLPCRWALVKGSRASATPAT